MSISRESPAALGYRAVAEWKRNSACIAAWPAHEYAWGEFLARAQGEHVAFCRALLADDGAERLELLVPDAQHEAAARAALGELAARVNYWRLPYGDVWLRDTTPIFVRGAAGLATVRFAFNGWGGKYDYPGDVELGARMQSELGLPAFSSALVTEGGALELDGEGTCLTTESCLLNPNRGGATRAAVEAALREALAVERVLWLRDGLAGDHTDGHIDNLARFAAPGVVLHMQPSDGDANSEVLQEIAATLATFGDDRGRRLRLVPVPSPGAVLDGQGTPMAASYMNFYLGNRAVIVPAFGSRHDAAAAAAIGAAFPGRRVVSCRANATLEGGGGTFHCMTRQRPLARSLGRSEDASSIEGGAR
jgi:agmatine deiminase